MSPLVEEFRNRVRIGEQWNEITWKIEPAKELLAYIDQLQAALALAEKAIGGECGTPNECDMCRAYRAIQAVKSGSDL